MQMFPSEARTAESYVAGLGASGALIASAIVVFVVLLGVVTFNAWPEGGLFGGGGNNVVDTASVSGRQQGPQELSLAKLLGGPVQRGGTLVAARPVSTPGGGAGGGTGGGGGPLMPNGTGGGGSTGGGTSTTQPGGGGSQSPLQQTVSGTGSQVQNTTSNLGSQVDTATNSNLGSQLLGPIGSTLNQTLQNVSGQLP
jgi:hypothetical protein